MSITGGSSQSKDEFGLKPPPPLKRGARASREVGEREEDDEKERAGGRSGGGRVGYNEVGWE